MTMRQWVTDLSGLANLKHAVSLNFRDVEVCIGDYDHHDSISSPSSVVPCSDMIGRTMELGSRVSATSVHDWKVGDRVMAIFNLTHVTGQITDDHLPFGLGLPLPGVLCEHRCFPSSGVLLSLFSSNDKLERAKQLGADFLINYKDNPEWQDEVMRITKDKGIDIIFEQGGPQTLAKSFACVKWGGMISAIGYLSGKQDNANNRINLNVLASRRNVTLKRIWNGPKDRLEEAVAVYEQNEIRPIIEKVFAFDQAKEALEYVSAGNHIGKVVINIA